MRLACALSWAAIVLLAGQGAIAAEPVVDFNREIRPLLAKKCFACHGPDEEHREAGLRLDHQSGATSELESGAIAIVPGQSAQSEFVRRIVSDDESERMPPKETGIELSPQQIGLLRTWINQGASYAPHWSFVKPVRPAVPAVQLEQWPKNGIDRFVLARLEEEGLTPMERADKYALIRRVSLDLRGIPPTIAEVEQFLHDSAPKAYESLVDRMLDDPAFGERWARMWLDQARYADSRGYGSDPLRPNIWPYRDWVIDAFNSNMPYDQFTVEQLAGDLLPNATLSQKIATGFHRNTMTNTEGGTDDEEFRVAAVKDRVDTTMQVWMGVTIGCAKCHNHKYEPISQKEYYQFFAIFNQTADADRGDESPLLPLPSPTYDEQIKKVEVELASLRSKLNEPSTELDAAQSKWEESLRPGPQATTTEPAAAKSEGEAKPVKPADGDRSKVPADILAIVDAPAEKRTDEQKAKLAGHYRGIAPALRSVRDKIAALEKSKPPKPTVPVMQELAESQRRKTHIMVKGNFLTKGDEVQPGLPAAWHAAPATDNAPFDRFAVARWLVHPDNPLTARVAVNRYWAQLFGTGIVETEEDFGTQGEPPSHPELLDWLATEFIATGWDTKGLLKTIVTSETYCQSSRVTSDSLAKDPQNRLFSRGARFRLEAEMVRDQALSLSGLLCRKMHGPSVFPPQPPGLWQAAFNGERTWKTSPGEDRYRRGLYTFWRRTTPYPSMATFDAPSRETCGLRRHRTNTPLQAFVTMNDPVYVEASQALARRIMREGGSSAAERAAFGLRLCLVRPPSQEQITALIELYQTEVAHYRVESAAAIKMATDPLGPLPEALDPAEAAAWTVVANVLLNLDAVLMRG